MVAVAPLLQVLWADPVPGAGPEVGSVPAAGAAATAHPGHEASRWKKAQDLHHTYNYLFLKYPREAPCVRPCLWV